MSLFRLLALKLLVTMENYDFFIHTQCFIVWNRVWFTLFHQLQDLPKKRWEWANDSDELPLFLKRQIVESIKFIQRKLNFIEFAITSTCMVKYWSSNQNIFFHHQYLLYERFFLLIGKTLMYQAFHFDIKCWLNIILK